MNEKIKQTIQLIKLLLEPDEYELIEDSVVHHTTTSPFQVLHKTKEPHIFTTHLNNIKRGRRCPNKECVCEKIRKTTMKNHGVKNFAELMMKEKPTKEQRELEKNKNKIDKIILDVKEILKNEPEYELIEESVLSHRRTEKFEILHKTDEPHTFKTTIYYLLDGNRCGKNECKQARIKKSITDEKKKLTKEKREQIMLDRYGVKNAMKLTKFKEKIKETNLEKYGATHALKTEESKQKQKDTVKKKYGVEYISQSREFKDNMKENLLKKYGVENVSELDEIKDKKKETTFKNYNVLNPGQSPQVQEKMKNTLIEKYGVEHQMHLESVKEKVINTNMSKYGVRYPTQSKDVQDRKRERLMETSESYRIIASKENMIEYLQQLTEENNKKPTPRQIAENLNYTISNIHQRIRRYELKNYITPGLTTPQWETDLMEYFNNIQLYPIKNDREQLNGKEIDFYFPDKHIGVELNGLYWHSDIFKDKNDHLNKRNSALEKGIKLIQIFEDEWLYNKDLVLNKLEHILGVSNKPKIYARKCNIREITSKQSAPFLEAYHIQGNSASSYKLGLFYNDELVSVMTFNKPRLGIGSKSDEIELNRFASHTDYIVVGAEGKLLNYYLKQNPDTELFSYADLRWVGEDNVYTKTGWIEISRSKPNYFYSEVNEFDMRRQHRFGFRKNILKDKFPEIYSDDKTEFEIMDEAGYLRIYDCGHIKYKKKS